MIAHLPSWQPTTALSPAQSNQKRAASGGVFTPMNRPLLWDLLPSPKTEAEVNTVQSVRDDRVTYCMVWIQCRMSEVRCMPSCEGGSPIYTIHKRACLAAVSSRVEKVDEQTNKETKKTRQKVISKTNWPKKEGKKKRPSRGMWRRVQVW